MYQDDNDDNDDKGNKKKSESLSGDLNANHKKQPRIENVYELSKRIFEQFSFLEQLNSDEINSFINNLSSQISIEEILKRLFDNIVAICQQLEDNFPRLIAETNALCDSVKQLSLFKEMDPEAAYTKANQLVPLCSTSVNFDRKKERKNKKIFLKLLEALSNTDVISTPLHKITLVKLGALYKLYFLHKDIYRVVEMLAALFVNFTHDVPDTLKYKEVEQKDATFGKVKIKCSWMEICEKAYQKNILELHNQDFLDSCKNLIMCYEGIIFPTKIHEEKNQSLSEINFPAIPPAVSDEIDEPLQQPPSRAYFCFNNEEFAILQGLVPEHAKATVCIPEIGGIAFDEFMRKCLSRQRNIKDTRSEEMKQRTAAIQFLFKIQEIVHQAHADLIKDVTGQIFDPHHGYVSWNVQPKNFFEKIKKCYEEYLKHEIKTEACELYGNELSKKFFERVDKQLETSLNDVLDLKTKESKAKSYLFKKNKLTPKHPETMSKVEKYKLDSLRMQNIQKIVEYVGGEHIILFAAPASGNAVFSVPKERLDDPLLELIATQPTLCTEKSVSLSRT